MSCEKGTKGHRCVKEGRSIVAGLLAARTSRPVAAVGQWRNAQASQWRQGGQWRAQFRYMVWLRGLPSRLRRLRLVLSCRCTSRKCLEAPVLVFVCLHVVRKNMVFIQLHRTFMVKMGKRGKGSRLVKVFAFRLPPIVCYTRPHSRISLHEVPAHSFVTTACSLASNALDIIFTLP